METDRVIPTIKSRVLVDGFEIVPDLEKSHGSVLVNQLNDKEIIDFGYNQFGSLTLGYNHPSMRNREYVRKLKTASGIRWALSDLYPEYYADFVETFNGIVPKGYNNFFFVDGGALAVENALKTAFDWKTRFNFKNKDVTQADDVLHFKEAFHGRSGYTLSLTNTADPSKHKFFPKFPWTRVHNPKYTEFSGGGPFGGHSSELAMSQIDGAVDSHGDKIAAIIIEPIQGEGGDNYFSPDFFRYLRRVSDDNNILLIFDEVQTGWSTGDWWAFNNITGGVQPDIFSFGKKTQQCGIAALTKRMDLVEDNVFKESSRINSTWGGTLADMVRSERYIEVIKQKGLHKSVGDIGYGITSRILDEADSLFVEDVRGVGGWQAFSLPDEKVRDAVWKETYRKGCLVLKSGERSIRMRPNLAVTEDEVSKGLDILLRAIKSSTK